MQVVCHEGEKHVKFDDDELVSIYNAVEGGENLDKALKLVSDGLRELESPEETAERVHEDLYRLDEDES